MAGTLGWRVAPVTGLRGAAAAAAAAVQHLHFAGDDFGGVAIIAGGLVLPLAGLQTALDIDLRTLAQVFGADLTQAAPHHDGVPLGLFLHLAGGLVAPAFRGRQAQVGDRGAAGGGPGFRILPEVADENDLVDAACHDKPLELRLDCSLPLPPADASAIPVVNTGKGAVGGLRRAIVIVFPTPARWLQWISFASAVPAPTTCAISTSTCRATG